MAAGPRALAAALLAAALLPLAPQGAAQGNTVRIAVGVDLRPSDGTAVVSFDVEDPGSLIRLTVDLGDMSNEPEGVAASNGFEMQGRTYTAAFPGPRATIQYEVDALIAAQTLEGRGYTSYVGPEFAVVRMGDLLPQLAFAFPENRPPEFAFHLAVDAPAAWSVGGPWPANPDGTFTTTTLPQGFLAAGPLAIVEYDAGGTLVRAVRVASAQEPDALGGVVGAGRSYLGALYGATLDRLELVVAPDPMYRGGLASPHGMFLHEDSALATAAHELVHVHQRFQPTPAPPDATVWFLEGGAVLHGALLQVVAGDVTLEAAQAELQAAFDRAVREPGIPAEATYGEPDERAAYDQGALVLASLDTHIRAATGGSRSLADVLTALNRDKAGERLTNRMIASAVANATGASADAFFARHVTGPEVPDVEAVSPERLVLRVAGTDPEPAVQGPVTVRLEALNLGVQPARLSEPARLDGLPIGTVTADVPVGAARTVDLPLGVVAPGPHALAIGGWRFTVTVLRPPVPAFNVTAFPPAPAAGDVLAVAVRIHNAGEAAYTETLRLVVGGVTSDETGLQVPGGEEGVVELAALVAAPGALAVAVVTEDGSVVWEAEYAVEGPRDAPAPPVALVLLILAALGPWRRRTRPAPARSGPSRS